MPNQSAVRAVVCYIWETEITVVVVFCVFFDFVVLSSQGQVVENLKAQALCSWTAKKENHLNFSNSK